MRIADKECPHPAGMGGTQKVFRFKNNYGASVVTFPGSYGHDQGLFELAVIHFNEEGLDRFDLTYDTPVTDDVIGYLSDEKVDSLLDQIENLPLIKN